MTMKIYIAGPMAGHPDLNRAAFIEAQNELVARFPDAQLVNPGHGPMRDMGEHLIEQQRYRDLVARDISKLLVCTHIYMLRNWNTSRGARAEHAVARWAGIPMLDREAVNTMSLRERQGDRKAFAAAVDAAVNSGESTDTLGESAEEQRASCMSYAGLLFLQEIEGVELQPYRDQAGIWTIGVGHVINDDEPELWDGISMEKAHRLLRGDVAWAERVVNDAVKVPLKKGQFDALVCFAFNVGAQAFTTSTLVKRVNQGRLDDVPYELLRWRYITVDGKKEVSQGLINRRERVGHLWRTGVYE